MAEIGELLDFQHVAADNDEVILCETLGGSVVRHKNGSRPMISYNPRAAMTIPEWPNCIALEPGGIHARRAYRNNLDLIALMVSITEIEAEEVRFVCPIFFVIRPRETDYLCYGQFRYPVDHASVSYEDKRVIFADGSIIDTGDIANFDFYLMAFYRCRVWLDIGST